MGVLREKHGTVHVNHSNCFSVFFLPRQSRGNASITPPFSPGPVPHEVLTEALSLSHTHSLFHSLTLSHDCVSSTPCVCVSSNHRLCHCIVGVYRV